MFISLGVHFFQIFSEKNAAPELGAYFCEHTELQENGPPPQNIEFGTFGSVIRHYGLKLGPNESEWCSDHF